MPDRTISSRLSKVVINLLKSRGMALSAVAEAIGVTKSFISRVSTGGRGLTIDHLIALERKLGEPLPLLLLKATPIESVPKELRPLYKSTLRVVSGGRRTAKAPARARRNVA